MKKVNQSRFTELGEYSMSRTVLGACKAGNEGGGTPTGGQSPPEPPPPPTID